MEFKCEVVRIDDVIEHPDADRLTIVKIGGYNCIANKKEDGSWRYQKGDLVVYIPEAAVLPEWLLKKMGFWDEKNNKGFLSGSRGNRVKAIKLRGVVSQGILYATKTIDDDMKQFLTKLKKDCIVDKPLNTDFPSTLEDAFCIGDDVAEFLNIIKYEPPIPIHMAGQVGNLFGYTKSYDIENLQKHLNILIEGEQVVMTEKLHGTLCQIGFVGNMPDADKEKAINNKDAYPVKGCEDVVAFVTSKGLAGKGLVQKNSDTNQDNLYIRVLNEVFLNTDVGKRIAEHFAAFSKNFRVHIFGEIVGIGVQDLGYGHSSPQLRVFDVHLHDVDTNTKRYYNALELANFCTKFGLYQVPILYSGPFSMKVAEEMRDGNTVEGKNVHIREGIVIRPVEEREYIRLPDNRVQLKFVSPNYLLRKDGTEYN